jgi:hypothetical protein
MSWEGGRREYCLLPETPARLPIQSCSCPRLVVRSGKCRGLLQGALRWSRASRPSRQLTTRCRRRDWLRVETSTFEKPDFLFCSSQLSSGPFRSHLRKSCAFRLGRGNSFHGRTMVCNLSQQELGSVIFKAVCAYSWNIESGAAAWKWTVERSSNPDTWWFGWERRRPRNGGRRRELFKLPLELQFHIEIERRGQLGEENETRRE